MELNIQLTHGAVLALLQKNPLHFLFHHWLHCQLQLVAVCSSRKEFTSLFMYS